MTENPYDCNICYEVSKSPVVTTCGHLYCWSCIYEWLNSNQELLQCPVCKNGITLNSMITLYTKDIEDNQDQLLPQRPKNKRKQPIRNRNQLENRCSSNLSQGIIFAGYGYFPSLFSLLFQVGNKIDGHQEFSKYKYFRAIQLILIMLLLINIVAFF